MAKDTMKIEVVTTDLIRDAGGYSANGCAVTRRTLHVDASLSDAKLARLIRETAGIDGRADFRADDWAGAEWSWRSGTIGVYADVVPII